MRLKGGLDWLEAWDWVGVVLFKIIAILEFPRFITRNLSLLLDYPMAKK